jgi:hypothetical protein
MAPPIGSQDIHLVDTEGQNSKSRPNRVNPVKKSFSFHTMDDQWRTAPGRRVKEESHVYHEDLLQLTWLYGAWLPITKIRCENVR